jgi:hypothetical protein
MRALNLTVAADGTTGDRGKFIEIWRQVDGEWKISNNQFNSDLPSVVTSDTEEEAEDSE